MMGKTVLLLHGWPRPIDKRSDYYKYFKKWGYEVVAPEIFSKDTNFTISGLKDYIKAALKGRKPDVLVGVSIGGLITPHIAIDYPDAKIVFVASGPKLEPGTTTFKLILNIVRNKKAIRSLKYVKLLPSGIIFKFCEMVAPFKGNGNDKELYVSDMKRNIKYILNIPISKEEEIVNFVIDVDNTDLLGTLRNKALIFLGKSDFVVSYHSSVELHNLVKNSKLVEVQGGHLEVISKPDFGRLEKFLLE